LILRDKPSYLVLISKIDSLIRTFKNSLKFSLVQIVSLSLSLFFFFIKVEISSAKSIAEAVIIIFNSSIQEWPIERDFEIGISKPNPKLGSFLQISEMLDVDVSTHIYHWGDRYDLSIHKYSKNRMIQHSQFWRLYRIHLLINQREKIDPNRKQMKIREKKKIPIGYPHEEKLDADACQNIPHFGMFIGHAHHRSTCDRRHLNVRIRYPASSIHKSTSHLHSPMNRCCRILSQPRFMELKIYLFFFSFLISFL